MDMYSRSLHKLLLLIVLLQCPFKLIASADYSLHVHRVFSQFNNVQLIRKAEHYERKGMIDSTLLCYTIIANRYKPESNDKHKLWQSCKAMGQLGYLYGYYNYNYEKSYYYLLRARRIGEQYHLTDLLPNIYMSTAILSQINSLFVKDTSSETTAMTMNRKAIAAAWKAKNWETYVNAMLNMINFAYSNHALSKIRKEIDWFVSHPIPKEKTMYAFTRHLCLALLSSSHHDYVRAQHELDAMENICAHFGKGQYPLSQQCLFMVYANKIELFMQQGLFPQKRMECLRYATKLEKIAQNAMTRDYRQSAYEVIQQLYMKLGDTRKAEQYELKALRVKDTIIVASKLSGIKEAKFMNDLQAVQNHMNEVERKSKELHQKLAISCGFSVVILVLFIGLQTLYLKIRNKNRVLYTSNLEALENDKENRQIIEQYRAEVDLLRSQVQKDTGEHKKYKTIKLSEERQQRIHEAVRGVLEDTTIICSQDFSLAVLSEKVGENTTYVSQVINERFHKNFSTLLGEYRVREACRIFNDPTQAMKFTIEAVGISVGFKSRTSFVNTFKKNVGLTPSEYIRMGREYGRTGSSKG